MHNFKRLQFVRQAAMVARLKHVYCILVGQVSLDRLERFMALENFTNKLAELNAAVDKVLSVYANQAAELDAEAVAGIQGTLNKVNAVLNPPEPGA